MERTSNNLRPSEHSHLNSQLSEPASSPSLPSEPPDVRNWFSSYVYESPALGSDEGFVASPLEERNCQNHSFDPEARCREEDERPVDFGNVTKINRAGSVERTDSSSSAESEINEVPDYLQSETQLSEPPDVRNWFSSYIYESPELTIDFGEDSSKEVRCGGEGFTDEKRKIERPSWYLEDAKHCRDAGVAGEILYCDKRLFSRKSSIPSEQHQDQFPRKIASYSESTSQLSEPPHISNWFSSYVYQSPELDTANSFRESFLDEKEPLRDVFATQGCNKDMRENLSNCPSPKIDELQFQKRFPSKQATHPPSQGRDALAVTKKDVPTFDILSTEHLERRDVTECDRSLQVDLEESWLNKSSTKVNLRQSSVEETNFTALQVGSVEAPMRNPVFQSRDTEYERADTNSGGFISVKKVRRRSNDENHSTGPRNVLKECSSTKERAPSACAEEDGIRRRPLSETTNFHDHPGVLGSAGKWKCPQKSKPKLGPPMKQLRLEKWVHVIGKQRSEG